MGLTNQILQIINPLCVLLQQLQYLLECKNVSTQEVGTQTENENSVVTSPNPMRPLPVGPLSHGILIHPLIHRPPSSIPRRRLRDVINETPRQIGHRSPRFREPSSPDPVVVVESVVGNYWDYFYQDMDDDEEFS